jgi:hypothetical protein
MCDFSASPVVLPIRGVSGGRNKGGRHTRRIIIHHPQKQRQQGGGFNFLKGINNSHTISRNVTGNIAASQLENMSSVPPTTTNNSDTLTLLNKLQLDINDAIKTMQKGGKRYNIVTRKKHKGSRISRKSYRRRHRRR